jgi:hypothetical protein
MNDGYGRLKLLCSIWQAGADDRLGLNPQAERAKPPRAQVDRLGGLGHSGVAAMTSRDCPGAEPPG